MITRYDLEDITFEEPFDPDAFLNNILGGGSEQKRELQGYTSSALRQLWRAGRISEEQWRAELAARDMSAQEVADEIAYQKTVGVSTAANANGALTPQEQAAVNAYKNSAGAAQPGAAPAAPSLNAASVPTGNALVNTALMRPNFTIEQRGDQWYVMNGTEVAGGPYATEASARLRASGAVPLGPTATGAAGTMSATGNTPASSGSPAAASGGSGGSSASAPSAPKAPLPNSAADLANRGAVKVGSTPVLEGQAYRRPNEVVQAADGQWYIVDPTGNPVGGPYPNQTQANTANVYQASGPAITSNPYAAIGNAALAGASRQRVGQGSGQNQAVNLDDIIGLTHQSGRQAGEFMGSTGAFGNGPVDVLRGNVGIPDYGGMRQVPGGGFTGRVNDPNGGEMSVGMSGIQQDGTQYGSHAQMMFAPYLSESQINRLNPEQYADLQLRLGTLRDQGLLQQADALTPTSGGGYKADTAQQAANYALLTGEDPYGIETLPEPYADGGSFMVKEPSVIRGLQTGRNYGVLGMEDERVTIDPTVSPQRQQQANAYEQTIARAMGPFGRPTSPGIGRNRFQTPAAPQVTTPAMNAPPAIPQRYLDMGGYIDEETRPNQIMAPGFFGGAYPVADLIGGEWNFRGPNISFRDMMAMRDQMPWRGDQQPGEEQDYQEQPSAWGGRPTPNIYAQGGEMMFAPQMPPSSRPSYLKMLAAGINRNMKMRLPVAAV